MPLNTESNYRPRALRPLGNDGAYAEIRVLVEQTAVREISRLARATDISFDALAAFGLAHLALHGRRLLHRETQRARKLTATNPTPASHV